MMAATLARGIAALYQLHLSARGEYHCSLRHDPLSASVMFNTKAILLACMPKSGSTFVAELLSKMAGYKRSRVLFRHNQTDMDKRTIRRLMRFRSVVLQQHVRATAGNRKLIRQIGMNRARPQHPRRAAFDP
jgi:hypothetical protein